MQNLPDLMTTKEAAEYLGIKPGTLEIWRVAGRGPRFCKIGRLVRYTPSDLTDYVSRNAKHSTSEVGEAA